MFLLVPSTLCLHSPVAIALEDVFVRSFMFFFVIVLCTSFQLLLVRKSMSEYDPRLVAPTCLYLAAKAEESTVQAKLLVFYSKKIRK